MDDKLVKFKIYVGWSFGDGDGDGYDTEIEIPEKYFKPLAEHYDEDLCEIEDERLEGLDLKAIRDDFYKAVMEESGGTYDEEAGEYVADDEETQEMLDSVSVFIRVGEEPEEDD